MKTRSQTKKENEQISYIAKEQTIYVPKYTVDIDFDGAREAWRANKKELPNCCYEYICGYITMSGKKCCRKPTKENIRCVIHKK
jgi:hypothetical protein